VGLASDIARSSYVIHAVELQLIFPMCVTMLTVTLLFLYSLLVATIENQSRVFEGASDALVFTHSVKLHASGMYAFVCHCRMTDGTVIVSGWSWTSLHVGSCI